MNTYVCPRCGTLTTDPLNVEAHYCAVCDIFEDDETHRRRVETWVEQVATHRERMHAVRDN